MYDRFKKYLNKWLKEAGTPADSIDDWLIGETLNNPNIKTTCNKDCSLKKPPFHVIYKYKTQKTNVNTSTNNNLQATTKTKSKILASDNNEREIATVLQQKQESNDNLTQNAN